MPVAPLVIVNPVAGGGRAGRIVPSLRELVQQRVGARLTVTAAPGDAERLAAASVGRHDRVVAVGGDGTVQEVVNGLLSAGSTAALGLVPVGRGNDLARSLRLPRDMASAWTVALDGHTAAIDALEATGPSRARLFVSAGGVGLDADVAAAMTRRRAWQRGRAGYLVAGVVELWRSADRPVSVRVDGGEPIDRRILLLAIANGAWYGGGMRIAPDARPDDGLLDLCVVGDIGRLGALRQIPNLYRGRHVHHRAVELLRGKRVNVDGAPDVRVHLDGEPFGALPITVTVRPAALRVAMPLR